MPNGRRLALGTVLLVAFVATGGIFLHLLLGERPGDGTGRDVAGTLSDDVPATGPATLEGRADARSLATAPLARLLTDLRHEEKEVRKAAAREIRERARIDETILPRLVKGLYGDGWRASLAALVPFGGSAAVPIAEFALSSSPWRRRAALAALERLGPAAAPAVDRLLAHLPDAEDEWDRWQTLRVLAAVGPDARQAVPFLAARLTPPLDDAVVEEFAETLLAIDGANPATLALLRAVLFDEETRARPEVLGVLGGLGPAAAPLLPIVVGLLEDPEQRTRLQAAKTLGRIGDGDRTVRRALVSMLEHDHALGQRAAARALVALGPEGVGALSHVASKVEDIDVRLNAAEVLLEQEGQGEACARVLLSVLAEECDKGWKDRALVLFAQLAPPPPADLVLPAILRALEDATLAESACRALANVPGDEARSALRETLGRQDEPDIGRSALDELLRRMR